MSSRLLNPLLYIFPFPSFQTLSTNSSTDSRAFPYDQPPATELLVLLSFLFFLNVLREVADYIIHAGIIAEICLGMVYGAPLAGILPTEWEGAFTVLGYLGLIGIVFEGGLSTDLALLFSNLPLSVLCASTGVVLPIAFSFALLDAGYGYSHLESFAAGAALSSTSLGTTLMALNSVSQMSERLEDHTPDTSEDENERKRNLDTSRSSLEPQSKSALKHTRIGTVLISAAIIDDVIGLVLSSVVPTLSSMQNSSSHSKTAWTIIRPLLSSLLMAAVSPIVARFILRPLFWWKGLGERWCAPCRAGKPWGAKSKWLLGIGSIGQSKWGWGTEGHADAVKLTCMILFVSAFSSIAYYTGSSVLFGAYLAGLTSTYISRPPTAMTAFTEKSDNTEHDRARALSFEEAYGRTVGPLQKVILAPLFFASIGYAIPFISLWKPTVLWKGLIFALLMAFAKIAVGLYVVLWSTLSTSGVNVRRSLATLSKRTLRLHPISEHKSVHQIRTPGSTSGETTALENCPSSRSHHPIRSSIPAAAFMGVGMISRGEIGLLIAQIARNGTGTSDGEQAGLLGDEAFSVCIWAIMLCTLVGPIGVGFVVRRWENRIRQGMWG